MTATSIPYSISPNGTSVTHNGAHFAKLAGAAEAIEQWGGLPIEPKVTIAVPSSLEMSKHLLQWHREKSQFFLKLIAELLEMNNDLALRMAELNELKIRVRTIPSEVDQKSAVDVATTKESAEDSAKKEITVVELALQETSKKIEQKREEIKKQAMAFIDHLNANFHLTFPAITWSLPFAIDSELAGRINFPFSHQPFGYYAGTNIETGEDNHTQTLEAWHKWQCSYFDRLRKESRVLADAVDKCEEDVRLSAWSLQLHLKHQESKLKYQQKLPETFRETCNSIDYYKQQIKSGVLSSAVAGDHQTKVKQLESEKERLQQEINKLAPLKSDNSEQMKHEEKVAKSEAKRAEFGRKLEEYNKARISYIDYINNKVRAGAKCDKVALPFAVDEELRKRICFNYDEFK